MNFLITICGRGGSKGIPNKNILKLGNYPLIYYSIKIAKEFLENREGKITLSTDSHEIKKVAQKYGLISDYLRPAVYATDDVGKIDAINDVLNYEEEKNNIKYDIILDLDIVSPLRTITDLNKALSILLQDSNSLNLFSVSPGNRNPYFNMVEKRGDYYFKVKNSINYKTRQSAPKVYDLNGSFYYYKRKFFSQNLKSVFTEKSLIYEVPHICFDIDHMYDLELMNLLLKNKKIENIL